MNHTELNHPDAPEFLAMAVAHAAAADCPLKRHYWHASAAFWRECLEGRQTTASLEPSDVADHYSTEARRLEGRIRLDWCRAKARTYVESITDADYPEVA